MSLADRIIGARATKSEASDAQHEARLRELEAARAARRTAKLSEAKDLTDEARDVLRVLVDLTQKSELVKLRDVAKAAKRGTSADAIQSTAKILGDLQRQGLVDYNLKTGYSVHANAKAV